MAEYQTGESTFNTGGVGELLPNELSDRYFQNLDSALQRAEKTQLDRTLGGLSDSGFLRSGDTFTQVSNQVLGPSTERRNAILLPELQRAADQGREERLSGVAWDRQKQAAATQHQYQLEELDKQAQIKRMLMELEDSLNGNQNQGFDLGGLAGTVVGGALGRFGGTIGAQAGAKVGGSLFSKPKPAPTGEYQ